MCRGKKCEPPTQWWTKVPVPVAIYSLTVQMIVGQSKQKITILQYGQFWKVFNLQFVQSVIISSWKQFRIRRNVLTKFVKNPFIQNQGRSRSRFLSGAGADQMPHRLINTASATQSVEFNPLNPSFQAMPYLANQTIQFPEDNLKQYTYSISVTGTRFWLTNNYNNCYQWTNAIVNNQLMQWPPINNANITNQWIQLSAYQ